MRTITTRRLVAGLLLASMLAACSSGGGGGGAVGQAGSDPAATVNSLVATLQAKQFSKIADLTCAAQKGSIASQFDPSAALGGALGVTAQDFLDIITISFNNMAVGAPQVSGNNATVHIKADMAMTADQSKLKDLIAKMLTAAGAPANDAAVSAAMAGASAAFSKTTPIDTDIPLTNEGGKWLLCGDLSKLSGG